MICMIILKLIKLSKGSRSLIRSRSENSHPKKNLELIPENTLTVFLNHLLDELKVKFLKRLERKYLKASVGYTHGSSSGLQYYMMNILHRQPMRNNGGARLRVYVVRFLFFSCSFSNTISPRPESTSTSRQQVHTSVNNVWPRASQLCSNAGVWLQWYGVGWRFNEHASIRGKKDEKLQFCENVVACG